MKCPKCGFAKAKYLESRRKYWHKAGKGSQKGSVNPRKDFTAKCPRCKFEFDIKEYYDVGEEVLNGKSEKI